MLVKQQVSHTRTAVEDVVVVGGGPAGISAAAALREAGVRASVLEQGAAVGTAWRGRYDRLRLNSSRFTSRLLGAAHDREAGLFPPRDAFVEHLERAARGLDVRAGVCAERIDRDGERWHIHTSAGSVPARAVVVATGYANVPVIPHWPGRDRFEGRFEHAAEYRNPLPFQDADVLVAGAGSSGMEIAFDLATGGAAQVRLAVRTPPNIALRSVGGAPGDPVAMVLARLPVPVADTLDRGMRRLMLGDLRRWGLPRPAEGPFARLRRLGVAPAIVDREVLDAIKDGRIEIVAAVARLDATGVQLADGARLEPDAVIAATGYRCGLEPIVGHLGVLDDRGVPDPEATPPGLHFVGYEPVPGQIRHMGVEARRAAQGIARELGVA
jgi:cation diffusion facilitator CzcD-associated flavoprotein CzcO